MQNDPTGAENFVLSSSAQLAAFIDARMKGISHQRPFVTTLGKKIEQFSKKNHDMRIAILSGLRGTGKTIGLIQIVPQRDAPSKTFLARGDELLANRIDLLELVEALDKINREKIGIGKKYVLFIDEVTYLPEWALKIKVLHDSRPDLFLVLTASSSLALAIPPDLARRSSPIEVRPLSFREYLLLQHGIAIPDRLSNDMIECMTRGEVPFAEMAEAVRLAGTKSLAGLMDDYLDADMPLALKTTGFDYLEGMKSVTRKIVYEDFAKYGHLDAGMLSKAEQIVFFLAKVPCDGVRLESLANHFSLSKDSISKILSLLEQSLLIKGVPAYGRRKAAKLPRKWLFKSASIRKALAKNLGADSDLLGNQREDAIYNHLSKAFGPESITYSHEADFVIPEKKLAFEVGNKTRERSFERFHTFTLTTQSKIEGHKIPLHLALLAF